MENSKLIAACYDGSLHGWDVSAEGKTELIFAFKSHLGCVKCVAVSNTSLEHNVKKSLGSFLATGGTDEVVRVYDLVNKREVGTLEAHEDSILSLAFVGNKFLLTGGKDGKLCLWRCGDWNLIAELKGHKAGPINSIAVHPLGKVALSTSSDNSVRLWNLDSARPASRNRIQGYNRVDFACWSPCGSFYAMVGNDRDLLFFAIDNENGKPVSKLEGKTRINAVEFVSKHVIAIGLETGKVVLYRYSAAGVDQASAQELICGTRVRGLASLPPPSIASSADNKEMKEKAEGFVVAALSSGEIQIWDVETREKTLEVHSGSTTHVTCVATLPPAIAGKQESGNGTETSEQQTQSGKKKRSNVAASEPQEQQAKKKHKTSKKAKPTTNNKKQ